jgi:hypothetical protein
MRRARSAARSRVSEVEQCLPGPSLCDLLAEIVVDEEGARLGVAKDGR